MSHLRAPPFGDPAMLDLIFILLGAGMLAALAAYALALDRL